MGADAVLSESYPALAEAVPRARSRVTGYALRAGASGERLENIRLATSEALTNVVVHAYPDEAGAVHVTVARADSDLWILVSDDGQGLQAQSPRSGLGLGLALIAQLCDEFAIVKRAEGGTELRMRFSLGGGATLDAADDEDATSRGLARVSRCCPGSARG